MAQVVLGLGSNLGDRKRFLHEAIRLLGENGVASDMTVSPLYESQAMLPENAPADWDIPYYNCVVRGETALAPHALLASVKEIERTLGRQNAGLVWAPREIDIDILAMENTKVDEPDLCIPHRHLAIRTFAVLPFADVSPTWTLPDGRTVQEIARTFPAVTPFGAHVVARVW